jgi:DNA invertase Pin-like site-specific DNA recombinase
MDKNIINFIKKNKPTNAYIYSRVSTNKQAQKDSHSLETQRKLCKEYINNKFNPANTFIYEDIGSSWNDKNVLYQLNKLVRDLEENSLILISKVSRLGRDIHQVMKILKKIEKKKSYVISVEEQICYNMSRIMNNDFMIKVIESEKESNILSESIRKKQKTIKSQGGWIGNPPYGYKVGRNYNNVPILLENPEEMDIINSIINLVNNNYSYDDIALYLTNKNILHKKNVWTPSAVKYILDKFYPEHTYIEFNINPNPNSNVNIISDSMEDNTSSYDIEVDNSFTILRSGKCIYK